MLVRKWINPSDYPNRDQFFDAYLENLADVKAAERFLDQFDPISIETRIKELRKGIIFEEGKGE